MFNSLPLRLLKLFEDTSLCRLVNLAMFDCGSRTYLGHSSRFLIPFTKTYNVHTVPMCGWSHTKSVLLTQASVCYGIKTMAGISLFIPSFL